MVAKCVENTKLLTVFHRTDLILQAAA